VKINLSFNDKGTQALVLTNLLGNVVRLLSNLVLARFLSPEAFAITGLAASVIFAFNMISDGGFRPFVLRHKLGDEDYLLKTVWTVKLVRNFLLAIIVFFLSDFISSFFNISDLSLVLKFLCLVFVVDAFLPIGHIAIERQNKVAVVMYIRFFSSLLSTIVSIVGVYLYQNYWAIIISMVLNNLFQVCLGYIFIGARGSALGFDRAVFVELAGWAKYIAPSSIITLMLVQFDKWILTKTLTVTELGLYFVAFNFSSAASTFTIQYARNVLQPYMSIIYRESPEEFIEKYYAKKMKISLLIAFSLGVLSGGSFIFFDVLYDERYLSASLYLSILLIMPIMVLVTYTSEVSLILHGQLRMTLIANILRLTWFLPGAWFGYSFFGVKGILCAIGLVEIFPAVYMLYRLKRINCVSLGQELLVLLLGLFGFGFGHFVTILFMAN
jgi:lipopolysaccharide exporter